MKSALEEARLLKRYAKMEIDRATRDKASIDVERLRERALPRLERATDILETDYKEAKDDKYKVELKLELADCYGMMGGLFRRLSEGGDAKANLEEATKMYEKGRVYEVDSSYNLSNSVVIPILIHPENLEEQQANIEEGIVMIKDLVRGVRKYDWWAWTDLGLFYLLSNNYSAAREAYEQATQLGALPMNYKSTLSVLEQLERTLKDAKSSFALSVAQSIGRIIGLLEIEKRSSYEKNSKTHQ